MASRHAGRSIDAAIREYWDHRIHDTTLSPDPPGSIGFFAAMDTYRYGRLDYLCKWLDFDCWKGRDVLDVGCGAGLDLVRFARAGAHVSGVDLSSGALALARQYVAVAGQRTTLVQADAAMLPFRDESFDLVLCHSVLPFARDCASVVSEAWRVLRHGGTAILMVYNRHSWLYALRALFARQLGHDDAPVFRTHTWREFDALLEPFSSRTIVGERLPAPTRVHRGLKRALFDGIVVRGARLLPERWIRVVGGHLVARCRKQAAAGPRSHR